MHRKLGLIAAVALIALVALVRVEEEAGSSVSVVTMAPIAPTADAYVDASAPKRKFGGANSLVAGTQPTRWSYLRFDVRGIGGPVARATLSLEATAASSVGFEAHAATGSWDERTITFANAPGTGALAGTAGAYAAGRVTVDVTALVQSDGQVNVALTSPSLPGVTFASRETGARGPRLEVAYSTTTAPAVTLTSPASGSFTRDRTPTFAGTAGNRPEDSSLVTVRVFAGTSGSGSVVQTMQAARTGSTWTVDAGADLQDGGYTAQAEQTDSSGDVGRSAANTFTVDTAAPAPTLAQPGAGTTVTTSTPTFAGTAGAANGDASTLTVEVFAGTAATGTPVQRLTATRSGTSWSTTSSPSLANGTYTAQVTQTDAAGNEGRSAASSFTVDASSPVSGYASAVMADSPRGYWRLGEPAGSTAIDQVGTSSGTYLGGVGLGAPGALTGDADTAAAFDGTDDTVRIPHASALNSTGALTLEALVNPGVQSGSATVMRKDLQYLLRTSPEGALTFRLWKSGTARELSTSGGLLVAGTWSHVAATYDGTTMRIFVNGTLRASTALAAPIDVGTQDLYLGASRDYDWLKARLDEPAVYATALSATRVQAHVAAAQLPDSAVPKVQLLTPKAGTTWPATLAYGGNAGTDPGDDPNVTVELFQGGQATGIPYRTLQASVRSTGVFSTADGTTLPSGTYTARATQSDQSGNVGASPATTVTVDASLPPRLIAAGDIAGCAVTGQAATGALLDGLGGIVVPLGDNAYENGTQQEYDQCYDPAWGRQRARTRPVPGNHDYANGQSNAGPYFSSFGASAGDPTKGYYSYNVGGWHVIALNAMCSKVGGCGAGSPQETWLRQDLAASSASCTVAYWHNARFSSGNVHGSDNTFTAFWQALYDYKADVVLNGHEHVYERFKPQTPGGVADAVNGIRQFTVGTGGFYLYGFGTALATSEVRNATTLGVLELTLRPGAYDWRFIPQAGNTFSDSGTTACH